MRAFKLSVALLAAVASIAAQAQAAGVPTSINYQGKLTTASGTPVQDGSYGITFALYAVPSGPEAALWTSDAQPTQVTSGLLTTDFAPPAEVILANPDLWLEVTVDGQTLTPRQKLLSVPFALLAGSVATGAVTSDALADDIYSLQKVSGGYLTAGSDVSVWSQLNVYGSISLQTPGQGIVFPDGSVQTSAAVGEGTGVPAGFSILGPTPDPPLGFTYSGAYVGSLDGDAWRSVASLAGPARAQAAAASLGTLIYVCGGGLAENSLYEYDTVANSWRTLANMPQPRRTHALVEAGGLIYAIGGLYGASGTATASVQAYDPASNTWTDVAPLPFPRASFAAASWGGLIYVVGGVNSGYSSVANLDVYDPSTNTWSPLAPLPTARYGAGAAFLDGVLYVAGGSAPGDSQSKALYAYDPYQNLWEPRSSMTTGRFFLSVQAVEGRIHAMGGRDSGSNNYLDNDSYDPRTDTWRLRKQATTYRQSAASAVAGGKIYLFGGGGGQQNGGNVLGTSEAYTPYKLFYIHTKD